MNDLARLRLQSQHLLNPVLPDAASVVSHLVAVQAQEYRLMRWAVEMRTTQASAERFQKAFDSGDIVRLHLMRGTWHLVAAIDYGWLFDLVAKKAMSVIKGWMSGNKISIPEDEMSLVSYILAETASDKGSATTEDFVEALARKDISMDKHRLSYHIRINELRGVLCSGNLTKMKATYSLVHDKIKNTVRMSREEALNTLTLRYFKSRGPATLQDFVWWSGLTVSECKRGVDSAGNVLKKINIDGREFLIHESCTELPASKKELIILPPYDEYLISYKTRDIAVPQQYRAKAHNNSGIFYPVVLKDGIVCGNWKPFGTSPEAAFFNHNADTSDISEQWAEYQRFLSS
ncbi:MAG: winged helix DNA-binding domain-containing protein [Bacteroidales bacterium]|nr:winged helix DNA-binding domain-containing protein [Bacteroidales bacterium]